MKLWMIALFTAFLVPSAGLAQNIEETALEALEPALDENGQPILIVTDSQKIEFIIETIQNLSSGAIPTKGTQDPQVASAKEVEARIHRQGPDAIRKYHGSIRSMMRGNVEWTKYDSMLLTINEIKMLSRHMNWKAMRSHLVLLDRYSEENFPIWTKMRVESWLVQAETMLALRPESLDKTRAIEGLIAKVRLAQKTSQELEYDFTISDRIIDIEERRVPDVTLLASGKTAEESNKKSFLKKLKFW